MVSKHPTKMIQCRSQRGAAAVLAMMFLVIFGSLAAAMAVVSQGNLATADSHLKVNRALAAAETGMRVIGHELGKIALGDPGDPDFPNRYAGIRIRDGVVTYDIASKLWSGSIEPIDGQSQAPIRDQLLSVFGDHASVKQDNGVDVVEIGPVFIATNDSISFTATVRPHAADPTRLVVRVQASDGPEHARIHRTIVQEYQIDKKIPYAILASSRVMLGRNVMIDGPIGSRFTETDLQHGHPVHILSDFAGLTEDFDELLEGFYGDLAANDQNGDNRLSINNAMEMDGIDNPEDWDVTGDNYITEWDLFLKHFGHEVDGEWRVTRHNMESAGVDPAIADELFRLIYTFNNPDREIHSSSYLSAADRYAKIQGQVYLDASKDDWEAGAAGGNYRDYLQGPIRADHGQPPLTFGAEVNEAYQFDFDVEAFRGMTESDLDTQADSQAQNHDPDDPHSPQPLGQYVTEPVAYGSAHPYDFFDRPVYENMTFRNVRIPKGTNALFRNCRFIGVTFVESNVNNTDPNYNFAGMQESDGTPKHPGVSASVDGQAVVDTKTLGNNIRFENCTFEGAIVTDAPEEFTHTRNKIAFNGETAFVIDNSSYLSESEKELFRRSTILAPHYSVEMGTFTSPDALGQDGENREYVELSGAIVGGIVDLRGNIRINGMIVTTFEPKSNQGPVIGETSPQFNTTIGYFNPDQGDLEGSLPGTGLGTIQIHYDPSLAMPDGILSPIQIKPIAATYYEGGN